MVIKTEIREGQNHMNVYQPNSKDQGAEKVYSTGANVDFTIRNNTAIREELSRLQAVNSELLEACKWALSLINGCEWGSTLNKEESAETLKLEAAIAKAEGNTP
jgi:hypothetical protein